jgi:hypothetical protein
VGGGRAAGGRAAELREYRRTLEKMISGTPPSTRMLYLDTRV